MGQKIITMGNKSFITLKNRFDDSMKKHIPQGPYLDFAKSNILSNKIVTLGDRSLRINKFTDKPVSIQ